MNWPHNFLPEDQLISLAGENDHLLLANEMAKEANKEDVLISDAVLDDPKKRDEQQQQQQQQQQQIAGGEVGDWGIEDLDIEEPSIEASAGPSILVLDVNPANATSNVASENFLQGNVAAGFQCLRKQIALKNPRRIGEELKCCAVQMVAQVPFIGPVAMGVFQANASGMPDYSKRVSLISMESIRGLLKTGYKLTTEGKFLESQQTFQQILVKLPLVRVGNKEEEEVSDYSSLFNRLKEVRSSIQICLNYVMAMKCELAKKKHADDPQRLVELGCYMALCNLQPAHRVLTLRAAMTLAFKQKNFVTAAQLARKLVSVIESAPANAPYAKQETLTSAKKVLGACEQQGTNAVKVEFEEAWLNGENFVAKLALPGLQVNEKAIVRCPYDQASHEAEWVNRVCEVCEMCEVGQQALGLKLA